MWSSEVQADSRRQSLLLHSQNWMTLKASMLSLFLIVKQTCEWRVLVLLGNFGNFFSFFNFWELFRKPFSVLCASCSWVLGLHYLKKKKIGICWSWPRKFDKFFILENVELFVTTNRDWMWSECMCCWTWISGTEHFSWILVLKGLY